MDKEHVYKLYDTFQASLDPYKVTVWQQKSKEFRDFWSNKLTNDAVKELSESEIDEVIRILHSSGKGNTKDSIAVARVMVPQGAWRRLFVELKTNPRLRNLLTKMLNESDSNRLMQLIDELYEENAGRKNNLTRPTASVVNAMLFAANPDKYLSVISLKDRKMVIDSFNFANGPDFQKDSAGRKCVVSNIAIIEGFRSLGINAPPRQVSLFLYTTLRPYWKPEVGKMNVGGVWTDMVLVLLAEFQIVLHGFISLFRDERNILLRLARIDLQLRRYYLAVDCNRLQVFDAHELDGAFPYARCEKHQSQGADAVVRVLQNQPQLVGRADPVFGEPPLGRKRPSDFLPVERNVVHFQQQSNCFQESRDRASGELPLFD